MITITIDPYTKQEEEKMPKHPMKKRALSMLKDRSKKASEAYDKKSKESKKG